MVSIQKSTIKFLEELATNNNRDWFNANKQRYLDAQENMSEFVDLLILEMNKHDKLENTSGKKSLYRIYNDVRFSKDKSPYNARFAFGFQRSGKERRGGYYVNIKPGNNYLSCGFFNPNPEDLKRIRLDIELNYKAWRKMLSSAKLRSVYPELRGSKILTAPRGFSKDHEAIDLLQHKQFILRHDFTDEEVMSKDFVKEVNRTLKAVRPFFDYMSEVLTTNLNGESLI